MKEKLIAGICMLVLFVSILGLSGCGGGSGSSSADGGGDNSGAAISGSGN
jgi:hypothetical protein